MPAALALAPPGTPCGWVAPALERRALGQAGPGRLCSVCLELLIAIAGGAGQDWSQRAMAGDIVTSATEGWRRARAAARALAEAGAYYVAALRLWRAGLITGATLRRALRERPVAVCGRDGAYVVDAAEYARVYGDAGPP